MQTIGKVLVVSILAALTIDLASAGDDDAEDKSEEWLVLEHSVQEILTGIYSDQTAVKIALGAQIAIGDTVLSLSDVVEGESKTHSILEKSDKAPVSVHLKMNDEENAAYLLLGTRPEPGRSPRYHTVVFMKDSTGLWLIESWHTSY